MRFDENSEVYIKLTLDHQRQEINCKNSSIVHLILHAVLLRYFFILEYNEICGGGVGVSLKGDVFKFLQYNYIFCTPLIVHYVFINLYAMTQVTAVFPKFENSIKT